jgi:hypothetical protein
MEQWYSDHRQGKPKSSKKILFQCHFVHRKYHLMALTASPKSGDIGIIPEMYKAKAVPIHAMKALGGEEIQLLLILDLGTRWGMSGQRHAPTAFYLRGKDPPVPTVQ